MVMAWLMMVSVLHGSCSAEATTGTVADTLTADTTAREVAAPDTITLLFVGDAMQHSPQFKAALRVGHGKSYDYSDCFSLIAPDVEAADYAVVNLEVPLGGGPDYHGFPNFSAPDAYAVALKQAGFDLFLTANNHCLDSGDKATRRTISVLDTLGVDHIGTYDNAADRTAKVPFVKDIKGAKIAFLNYTYGTNGLRPTDGVEVSLINRQRMASEIQQAREAGARYVIVTLHWGEEYEQVENASQRSLAQYLIDQGVDMIIGSHPHVVQPMKVVRDSASGRNIPVAYSLGNFLSNQNGTTSRGGALVRARLVVDPDSSVRFIDGDYDLFFTGKPEGANRNYRVVPSWMTDSIPAAQRSTFRQFDQSTSRVLNRNNVAIPRRH